MGCKRTAKAELLFNQLNGMDSSPSTTDVRITDAVHADIPRILDLLYELERPQPSGDTVPFEELVCRYMSDQDKRLLVARVGDEIVGMASMMFLSRLNRYGDELYIPELIVLKGYRSTGIGKRLIDACLHIGEDRRCHRVRLESGNKRKGSHEFYRHLGFEQHALSFVRELEWD